MITATEKATYAGYLADCAVESLKLEKIKNAAVFVTDGYAIDYPLAIRTPDRDGWGIKSKEYAGVLAELTKKAEQQARCALNSGRTSDEQMQVLRNKKRSNASYGPTLPADTYPSWAKCNRSDLTVVAVAELASDELLTEIAEDAVTKTKNGHIAEPTEAAQYLWLTSRLLEAELPEGRVGFSMIALQYLLHSFGIDNSYGLAVVGSQASAKQIDAMKPSNFDIVKAKALSVATTGLSSGPKSPREVSRIYGAIPAHIYKRGNRILALGGLPDGLADVKIIDSAIDQLRSIIGINAISKLAR